jgi:hypothetical protein
LQLVALGAGVIDDARPLGPQEILLLGIGVSNAD